MNEKTKILGLSLAVTLAVTAGISSQLLVAHAATTQVIRGDLTAPENSNPFGGEKIGEFVVNSDGHRTQISANVNIWPSSGKIFEGWLVDTGTGYKLSLGQLKQNGQLNFEQQLVNARTYDLIVITEEPANDSDPNPTAPEGGSTLPSPFGQ